MTRFCQSVTDGTLYPGAHGPCLAVLVLVVCPQLSVMSVFAQAPFVKLLLQTNPLVSVLASSPMLPAIVVDCCEASPKAKPLFLPHWKYCPREIVQSVLAVVAPTLQAAMV